jgi:hypothetical protein
MIDLTMQTNAAAVERGAFPFTTRTRLSNAREGSRFDADPGSLMPLDTVRPARPAIRRRRLCASLVNVLTFSLKLCLRVKSCPMSGQPGHC